MEAILNRLIREGCPDEGRFEQRSEGGEGVSRGLLEEEHYSKGAMVAGALSWGWDRGEEIGLEWEGAWGCCEGPIQSECEFTLNVHGKPLEGIELRSGFLC